MASRSPTRVITQRLWSASISRSSKYTPSIFMASTIASTLALSRPSEKLGTHSTRVDIRQKNNGQEGRLQPSAAPAHLVRTPSQLIRLLLLVRSLLGTPGRAINLSHEPVWRGFPRSQACRLLKISKRLSVLECLLGFAGKP